MRFAQEIEQPSPKLHEDSIYQAILAHYKDLASLDINEYEDLKKYNRMRYMPNVGYSALYGVNASFSFNTVSRAFNENQVKKAKRNQIDKKYVLQSMQAYPQYIRLTRLLRNQTNQHVVSLEI
jgi:hypothetical protein